MNLSPEWLLCLLLVGLYLHECLLLVPATSAFLMWTPLGWRAVFPSASFTLAGRHVLLGPILPPSTPLLQLDWQATPAAVDCAPPDHQPTEPQANWTAAATALGALWPASAAAWFAVILVVPAALLSRRGDMVVMAALALAYAGVVATIACLWLARSALGLTAAACAKLTAEMLLCPPIAANVARRVSLQTPVQEGFITAARKLLAPAQWELAREELARRISWQMEMHDAGSTQYTALQDLKARLG